MNQYFVSLILGLTSQAESALDGKLPEGAEATGNNDPRQLAKALIDTLAVLQEKTSGNLAPEEKQLLDQALTTLRFRYVGANGS